MSNPAAPAKPECFVIMPIADRVGYPPGHFGKVYDQIIAPAVRDAGYEPRLASNSRDSVVIPLEIVSQLLNAPLAICDISDLNPNVMFELGFRQAFDKPVVIIKDDKTTSPFDINSIRYVPYASARLYEDVIKSRSELLFAIQSTASGSKHSVNSLVRLLNVSAAARKESDEDPTSARLELIERSVSNLAASVARIADKNEVRYSSHSKKSLSNKLFEMTVPVGKATKVRSISELYERPQSEWDIGLEESYRDQLLKALRSSNEGTDPEQSQEDQGDAKS